MAEDDTVRLSLTQIMGAAVAAVLAAVAASFLGVYGTIIGAAVMSVISTAGTVLYEQTVRRSKSKLNNLRQGNGTDDRQPRWRAAWDRIRPNLARPRWWKPVGIASLAIFVGAIGTITLIEAGIGRPLAATVTGGKASGGTSIQLAVTGSGDKAPRAPRAPRNRPEHTGRPGGSERDASTTTGTVRPQQDSNPASSTQQRPPGGTGDDQDSPATTTTRSAQPSPTQEPNEPPDDAATPDDARQEQQAPQQ